MTRITTILLFVLATPLLLAPGLALSQEAGSTGNTTDAPSQSTQKNAQPGAAPTAPTTQGSTPAAPAEQGAAPAPAPAEQGASKALQASEEEKAKTQKESAAETVESSGLISGNFEVSITESYTHTSANQLYIDGFGILPIVVVGNVEVQSVRRDIFNTTLGASYKLTDKLQWSVRLPWQYSMSRVATATGISGNNVASPNKETTSQAADLGDISTGFTYQLLSEGLNRPLLFGGLDFKARNGRDVFETPDPAAKSPVGSGFYSLRGSLSASKSTSPAVVFGSLSYAYAFPRNQVLYQPANQPPALINYKPAPNISMSAGVALSINYQLSLNFSYAQSLNFSSKINGNTLPNSATDAITFRMGGIWRISEKTSIDLSSTFGISPDAPDFTLALRVPWRF
jgi:hypothetical protein